MADEEDEVEENVVGSPLRRKIVRMLSSITIEPGAFLFTLSYGLCSIIAQNLLIKKVCEVNLGFNSSVCDHQDLHQDVQEQVQREVTILNMYTNIVACVPGIFSCLFVGAWSDSHGRKLVMILPVVGHILTYSVLLLLTYLDRAPAEWYLTSGLYGLFGGMSCFTIGLYSYISDISGASSRTSRVSMLDFFMLAGYPTGAALSAVIFRHFGYYAVFGSSAVAGVLNLLYLTLAVPETRGANASHPLILSSQSPPQQQQEDQEVAVGGGRMLLHYSNLVSTFRTCFRQRPNNGRWIFLMLIVTKVLHVAFNCSSLTYLYTRLKFQWTEQQYSLWTSTNSVMSCFGTALVLPFLSYRLGVHDGWIGVLGAVSALAGSIVMAFMTKSWMMYLGSSFGLLELGISIIIRAVLSKLGSPCELGKIFSLISCLESLMPLASSPLVTFIYNSTISTFPGAVYLVQSGVYLVVLAAMTGLLFWAKTTEGVGYGLLVEEEVVVDNRVVVAVVDATVDERGSNCDV